MTSTSTTAEGPAHRWLILPVLCLSVLLVAIDNTIVNVAIPSLSRELDASTSQLQWVVDAYSLVFATLLLVAGNLGDRLGRKPVLQVGLVLFAAASLAAALSSSVGQLTASRAAMGVAAALVYPTTLATIPRVFPDRQERAIAIGIWSGVSGLAIALGPVTGGLLLRHFWWGSIFLVNLPLVALAVTLGAVLVPNSGDKHPGRFDTLGALLSIAALGLLVWTIIEAPVYGWADSGILACFGGSVVLLVAFLAWESRRTDPLLDVSIFANPRFSAASAAIAMAFFALFGFIFMITMYFQLIRGYDTLKAGLATLPYAAVMGGMSPVAMLLAKRFGAKVVVGGGMALMTAGLLLASEAGVNSPYWRFIVVCMVLMAAGMALATGPATDSILATLPSAKAGVGSAVNDATREVGGALGVGVVGSMMSWFFGSRLGDLWGALQVPHQVIVTGKDSVAAAVAVGMRAPGGPSSETFAAVGDAFMNGLRIGCYAAAAATFLSALAAFCFLPKWDRAAAVAVAPRTELPGVAAGEPR